MKDKESQKTRGFGFVTYDQDDTVEIVVASHKEHFLLGKWVDVKKATPKTNKPYQSPNKTPVR
jgi:RNA recognition motif-containing protein